MLSLVAHFQRGFLLPLLVSDAPLTLLASISAFGASYPNTSFSQRFVRCKRFFGTSLNCPPSYIRPPLKFISRSTPFERVMDPQSHLICVIPSFLSFFAASKCFSRLFCQSTLALSEFLSQPSQAVWLYIIAPRASVSDH